MTQTKVFDIMSKKGLGNWVKKGVVSFSMAVGRVEKDLLQQTSQELDNHRDAQVNPFYRNQLMADLKAGKVTEAVKEFRAKHYLLLKEAEKYKVKWGFIYKNIGERGSILRYKL